MNSYQYGSFDGDPKPDEFDLGLFEQRFFEQEGSDRTEILYSLLGLESKRVGEERIIEIKNRLEQAIIKEGTFGQLYKLFACEFLLEKKHQPLDDKSDESFLKLDNVYQRRRYISQDLLSLQNSLPSKDAQPLNLKEQYAHQVLEQLEAEFVRLLLVNDMAKVRTLMICVRATISLVRNEEDAKTSETLAENAILFTGAPHRGKQALGALFMCLVVAAAVVGILALVSTGGLAAVLGIPLVSLFAFTGAVVAGTRVHQNRRQGLSNSFFELSKLTSNVSNERSSFAVSNF